jgi:hypothetical protein
MADLRIDGIPHYRPIDRFGRGQLTLAGARPS